MFRRVLVRHHKQQKASMAGSRRTVPQNLLSFGKDNDVKKTVRQLRLKSKSRQLDSTKPTAEKHP